MQHQIKFGETPPVRAALEDLTQLSVKAPDSFISVGTSRSFFSETLWDKLLELALPSPSLKTVHFWALQNNRLQISLLCVFIFPEKKLIVNWV